MIQEELGNGQQSPGISGIAADPAVQDLQEGSRAVHVGGVLFADDVHDGHRLNETLQENRESGQSGGSHGTASQSFSPTSAYLQLSAGLHQLSSGPLPETEVKVKL